MRLKSLNSVHYIKEDDTFTPIQLQVIGYDDKPFDLSEAEEIVVKIGTSDGMLAQKKLSDGTLTRMEVTGGLEFRLDVDDQLVRGANFIEVQGTINSKKFKAPSKGYYKLNIEKSMDSIGQVVTKITLDYFIEKVDEKIAELQDKIDYVEETREYFETHLDETVDLAVDNKMTPFVDEVSAHLAETETKLNLDGWELQNKTRKVKPLVTFIDDDGRTEVLTKLKPLSEKYGIPFTVAAFVKQVENTNNTNYMNKEDLVHLQNDLGWEISSHTYNHPNLSHLSYEEQEYELRHSKEVLENWGLKVETICYPFDGRNDDTYELARKYYRAGRRTGGGINTSPLETFEMRSVPLGSWFDHQGDFPIPTNSLEYYKYRVDQAVEQNGWVIFMTHTADPDHDATQQQYLEETIQYALSLNVEIVTFAEGLNRMGNILDTGHYSKVNNDKKHFVIGADGTLKATDVQDRVKKTKVDEILNDTPPSEIKFGYIYQTRVRTGNATGLPNGIGGNLITNALDGYADEYSYVFQEYRPYNSSSVYVRTANNDNTWSDWFPINTIDIILDTNEVDANTPITYFETGKISHCRITTGNATDFPRDEAGLLITNRIVNNPRGLNYQEYRVFGRNEIYTRGTNSSGEWLEWELVNSMVVSLPNNAVNSETTVSEFPPLKVSYCRINGTNAVGFPSGAGGKLTTDRTTTGVAGYAWQEYDVYNSWRKFKRYERTDGTWSEWKEFVME